MKSQKFPNIFRIFFFQKFDLIHILFWFCCEYNFATILFILLHFLFIFLHCHSSALIFCSWKLQFTDYSRSYQTEALLGPVDGSLYATILKSPTKSKGDTPLLSPPPQFSNNHHHNGNTEVIERQPLSSSTPVRNSYSSGSHQRSYSSSTTSQSTVREVSVPPRTSSLISSATTTPDYCYLENQHPPRSSTSQSNYSQNPVIITEIISNGQNGVNGNRESVKSPLTLSMDSGISSNCLNSEFLEKIFIDCFEIISFLSFFLLFFLWIYLGPLARSSVSPLSFPSQNSPQGEFVLYVLLLSVIYRSYLHKLQYKPWMFKE